MLPTMDAKDTYDLVQKTYGKAAANRATNNIADLDGSNPDSRGGRSYEENIATAFGYSVEALHSVPDQANLGLSCGNPLAAANLRKVGGSLEFFPLTRLFSLSFSFSFFWRETSPDCDLERWVYSCVV
jgi:hypothetical protein